MATKQAGPGCLIPFGLLFVIVGCIPGCIALNDLHSARTTQGWIETTATIEHVELNHGDDTASVDCRYRYRAPDPAALEKGALKDYEGTRVGIHGGSDNVGSWQMDTFARLDAAARQEQPVPCWYDPADPGQAVLDRGERWELIGFMLIFPLVFGLAGGGIAWFGFHQWRKGRQPPAEPRIQAAQPVILAQAGSGCVLWIVAVIWNAISWAAVVGVLASHEVPTAIRLLIALFPLIGLGLLWGAAQSSLRRLRHGRPRLRLDAGSWTAGDRVRATLLTRTRPEPGDSIEAGLKVTRSVTTGSGDDRKTTTTTLWSLDLTIDAQAGGDEGGEWAHRVELPLPGDLQASDDDVTWKLEWQLIRPGPDLSATFILPVVAGDGTSELKALDLKAAADRAAPLAVLNRAGIRVGEERGEVVITVSAGRNPGLYLTGLSLSALLTIGAVALAQEVAWWTALISVPILLLCWRGALRSALWRSVITLGPGRVAVTSGWWRLASNTIKGSEIMEIERKTNMSSGETSWFNMWLKTADGARIPIARTVPGPAAARLAEMIEAVRR